MRRDLCAEAIRLGRLLSELLPAEDEHLGLLALRLLHDSRRETRVQEGRLVTLEEQDRSHWDQARIREGLELIERALQRGPSDRINCRPPSRRYMRGPRPCERRIGRRLHGCMKKLFEFNRSPVIALNHAVALAMSGGLEEGLRLMDALDLDHYYLFHAARADIPRTMDRQPEAIDAYRKALTLATNRLDGNFWSFASLQFGIV